jgi:hypothetical protein
VISDKRIEENRSRRFSTLGVCWFVYGVLRLLAAVWLVSFSNTATVMFGALLARVRDPFSMMSNFHVVYALIIALSVACGVFGVFAGLALLAGQAYGRVLAVVAGLLSLSEIPLGITLGVYTLIVLLPLRDGQTSTVPLRERTSELRSPSSAM